MKLRSASRYPDSDAPSRTAGKDNLLDSAKLLEIYSRTAAFYDEVVAEHQAAAKLVALDLMARRPEERFLEVSFGTAWALSRELQRSGSRNAVGLEIAEGMLEVGRDRLRATLDTVPLLLLGDGERMPFREESFDCLLCTFTLECMPEALIDRTLQEMRRILRPKGRVILADLTEGEGEDSVISDEWKQGFARDPEYYGGARPISLRPILQASGFEVMERRYSGHGQSWPSEIVLAKKA